MKRPSPISPSTRQRLIGALAVAVFGVVWMFDTVDPRQPAGVLSLVVALMLFTVLGYRLWPALAAAFARVPDPTPMARARRILGGLLISVVWVLLLTLIDIVAFGHITARTPSLVRSVLVGTFFGYLWWPGITNLVQQWRDARARS